MSSNCQLLFLFSCILASHPTSFSSTPFSQSSAWSGMVNVLAGPAAPGQQSNRISATEGGRVVREAAGGGSVAEGDGRFRFHSCPEAPSFPADLPERRRHGRRRGGEGRTTWSVRRSLCVVKDDVQGAILVCNGLGVSFTLSPPATASNPSPPSAHAHAHTHTDARVRSPGLFHLSKTREQVTHT